MTSTMCLSTSLVLSSPILLSISRLLVADPLPLTGWIVMRIWMRRSSRANPCEGLNVVSSGVLLSSSMSFVENRGKVTSQKLHFATQGKKIA